MEKNNKNQFKILKKKNRKIDINILNNLISNFMINEYEAANLEINKNKWILKSNNYRTPPKFRKKYLSFCACYKIKDLILFLYSVYSFELFFSCILPIFI